MVNRLKLGLFGLLACLGATAGWAADPQYYFRQVGPSPSAFPGSGAPIDTSEAPPDGIVNAVPGSGTLMVYGPYKVRARTGLGFSLQLTAQNAEGPILWSTDSPLPAGLTLGAGGLLSGIPTQVGEIAGIVVRGVDNAGKSGSTQPFTIAVRTVPTLTVTGAGATVVSGQDVALKVEATDVYGTANWSVSPPLPVGLVLDSRTGAISGQPLQAGTFTGRVVTVIDGDGAVGRTGDFSLTVTSRIAVTGLQSGYSGRVNRKFPTVQPYAAGTAGPYEWSLASGTLPAGLGIDKASGSISGTPTAMVESPDVALKVRDVGTGDVAATPPFAIRSLGSPVATVQPQFFARTDAAVSISPRVTGLIGSPRVSVVGSVPPGLSVGDGGSMYGTPSSAGTTKGILFKVVDLYDGATAYTAPFAVTVGNPPSVASPGALRAQAGVPTIP